MVSFSSMLQAKRFDLHWENNDFYTMWKDQGSSADNRLNNAHVEVSADGNVLLEGWFNASYDKSRDNDLIVKGEFWIGSTLIRCVMNSDHNDGFDRGWLSTGGKEIAYITQTLHSNQESDMIEAGHDLEDGWLGHNGPDELRLPDGAEANINATSLYITTKSEEKKLAQIMYFITADFYRDIGRSMDLY